MPFAEKYAFPIDARIGTSIPRTNDFKELFYVRWGQISFNVFWGFDLNIKVVLNRRMKKSEISLEDAEAGIGNELYWAIPNDFGTTMEAINNGKPLLDIAPKARITKNIFGLASSLSTSKEEKPKKKWSFFKR